MTEPIVRVTLFVPGRPASLSAWESSLGARGLLVADGEILGEGLSEPVGVEWVPNDGEFGAAFSYGTVADDDVDAIDELPGALVLWFSIDLRERRDEFCAFVRILRDAGALAVRLEQSKVGWAIDDWLQLMESGRLQRVAVALLSEDGALQSCGMHAFSLPDARIQLDGAASTASSIVSALNVYQLAEDPLLLSGQTFAPDAETPRRVLQRWPDTGYPSDHSCHNPYGVWRLGPQVADVTDVQPQRPSELAVVFVPSLRAILGSHESKSEQPLTRGDVERLRDEAPCITMAHRDVQRMERARGYADIDPELVWEQWLAVRAPDTD